MGCDSSGSSGKWSACILHAGEVQPAVFCMHGDQKIRHALKLLVLENNQSAVAIFTHINGQGALYMH